jgi:hypothetical protein
MREQAIMEETSSSVVISEKLVATAGENRGRRTSDVESRYQETATEDKLRSLYMLFS